MMTKTLRSRARSLVETPDEDPLRPGKPEPFNGAACGRPCREPRSGFEPADVERPPDEPDEPDDLDGV
ncbi:MAG: hypothetical protein U5R31_07240 [Acidimicrobiia bacterium]|nr:hypothetical protein [Acidimicrobiia bacterium]